MLIQFSSQKKLYICLFFYLFIYFIESIFTKIYQFYNNYDFIVYSSNSLLIIFYFLERNKSKTKNIESDKQLLFRDTGDIYCEIREKENNYKNKCILIILLFLIKIIEIILENYFY